MKRRHNRPESRPEARETSLHPSESGPWWHPFVIILVTLVGAAWFLVAEHEIAGTWGYSLDDSWIYATYAKNLALGRGYVFNPGEHVAGATGPLYVFILALLYQVFHDVVLPAKFLGIICLAASAIIVSRTVHRACPDSTLTPFLAGALVAGSPPLIWGAVSGLEIAEYLLLACIGMYFYVREKWTLALLSWSLGVWLRPDGLLLVLLGLLLRPRVSFKNSIGPLSVAGVIVGAYLLFNHAVGGSVLPNSVKVGAKSSGSVLANQWIMLKQFADQWGISQRSGRLGAHSALLVPGMAVGSVLMFRKWPAFIAYLFGFSVSLALYRSWGGQFGRYIVYTVPFGIALGVIGLEHASRRALGQRYVLGVALVGVLCLGWQVYEGRKLGVSHGWNVQNINGMQRFTAEATRRATSPGDTIAVNDVGAIGYFSGCYVVDLVGLVSQSRSFPDYLRLYRPKYMIIFPDWFQAFATMDWKTNQVVFYDADSTYKYSPFLGVRLRKNTISSRNTMYLYERMGRGETGIHNVPIVVH